MEERRENQIAYTVGRWPLDNRRNTLVFIHGSGGSSVLWNGQVDALSDRVNTLALDLPGHGGSTGSGMDRMEDYTRAVVDFLQAIQVPGVIPCGLSLGGGIAQQLLLDHGDDLKAGVLVGTGARLRVLPVILDSIRNDYDAFVSSTAAFAASPKTDPDRLRPLTDSMANCPPGTTLGDFTACDAFDVMGRIASIRLPVLVVNGEDDKLTPLKYGAFLAEHIPRAHHVLIPDAGHLAPAERPEAMNRVLRDFLDQERL